MKKESKLLIRGIGIGVIATSLLFYCMTIFSVPQNVAITNEEVIEKAKALGMIFITDIQNNPPMVENIETDTETKETNGETTLDESDALDQDTN